MNKTPSWGMPGHLSRIPKVGKKTGAFPVLAPILYLCEHMVPCTVSSPEDPTCKLNWLEGENH